MRGASDNRLAETPTKSYEQKMNKPLRAAPAVRRRAKTLRADMTYAERAAWSALRRLDGLPGRFRRQEPIGPYVVDFVCYAARLIVEVDGGVHDLDEVAARDQRRDAWLETQGFEVVRFTNNEILESDAFAALVLGVVRERICSGG